MREELNSKKQITQIYLIMFSLVLPQLFADIIQNNINSYQKFSILLFSGWFVFYLLMYYVAITKTGDLTEFDIDSTNTSAIFASISFGFVVAIFLNLAGSQTGMKLPTGLNLDIIHYLRYLIFLMPTTGLIIAFVSTLIIKTKKEIPVDDIANEIIRLRSNPFMNMIRKNIWPNVDIMTLVISLLLYSGAIYISNIFLPS